MHSGDSAQAPHDSSRRWPRFAAACARRARARRPWSPLVLGARAGQPELAAAQSPAKPNIIVLLTDDQEARSMRVMKIVGKELKRKGVTMKRFYDNFPLCCPVADDDPHRASTRTTTRCSRTRRPTAATASSTSCTATTTCRCGCRRPGTRPPTSASSSTATPSPTSTAPSPTDVPQRAGTTGTRSPLARPVLQLHAQQQRLAAPVLRARGGLQHRRVHDKAQALHPLEREGRHARSSSSSATPRRTAAAGASRAARATAAAVPGAAPPLDPEGQVQEHAAALVQRGGRLRQAVDGRRAGPLTPGQVSDTLRKRRCAWESLLAVDESVKALC